MRRLCAILRFAAIIFCVSFGCIRSHSQGTPIPPGVRQADKELNTPVEPPLVPPLHNKADPAQLQKDAKELAQLSASIPDQVNQVVQGRVPKNLTRELKQIEKLAKHLRSEINP